ncbi:MAG: RluA family pseudouridine synthase [Bacilli bacterium]
MNKNYVKKNNRTKDFKNLKEYKVNEDIELLPFLLKTFPSQSRNSIKSLLGSHRVSIDGAPITQFNFKLYKGDTIIISSTPIRRKTRSNLPIIYEDDDLIVINKPTGLLSIASDKEKCSTVYRMLTDYVQQKDKHNRIFIVHRLDEDTSGVLMVVKSPKLKELFMSNWNDIVKKRGYFAIVEGHMENESGTYKSYLKKNAQNMMYSSMKSDGQYSITHYKVMKEIEDYSLLDVNIDTGRKNQIRVHLFEHHHSVIGDDKYGDPSNPISRLGLHAYELDIVHPITGKLMKFCAPMPIEFKKMFNIN